VLLLMATSLLLPTGLAHAQPDYRDTLLEKAQTTEARGAIRPVRLACESLSHPLSIEAIHPHLSWLLDSRDPAARGLRQTAYRILVSSSRENIDAGEGDFWDTGKVTSTATTHIEYGGIPLLSNSTYYWKVQAWDQDGQPSDWSDSAQWTMGLLHSSDWKAKWIAARPDGVSIAATQHDAIPLPIFRHRFSLEAGVSSALVRICGLGQYELRINGQSVNEGYLSPGWTDYRKTVLYDTFDVTHLLQPGENAIGILLGNGMYNVPETPGRYQKFVGSQGEPRLLFQLSIALQDGTQLNVASDQSWKQTAGPITFSSTYGGEDFDARQEPAGWDRPGFDDNGWHSAVEVSGPGGKLVSEIIPAVKVMQMFPAVKITEPKPGVRIYDLGQNFSGWPKIKAHGVPGTVVKLIPGELLDDNGLVNQRSSGDPVWFSYVLRGTGEETWHPRFGYYGFRYVQVEEIPPVGATDLKTPALVEIEGQFVHSSAARTGEFASSSDQLNRIHALILAAVDSNTQSILTDCPHREKLGWLEESHLLAHSLMYNYELSHLYDKIAADMGDAQLESGLVPDIAPEYVQFERGFRDSPEWGSASILAPWIVFQHYGDRRILADHYPTMRRYAQYLGHKSNHGIISYGLGDWYDIGPGEPGESKLTGRGVTATAIYYQDLVVLQQVARLLGKSDDAAEYSRLGHRVRKAFNAKLFNSRTHRYDTGSQTANAMPLAVGLVPSSERSAVLAALVADIRQHDNHVTAGDIGFHYVVTALLQGGRSDVLFDMISRNDNPSYGYQLKQGATTLTEAWDTNPADSQNHFMLGHIEEWFHRGLTGLNIDLSREENERIVIQPHVVGDIAWARDVQDSVLGTIVSEWKRDGQKLFVHVKVPVNATATVHIPTTMPSAVKENGQTPLPSAHVRKLRDEPSAAVYEVGSGDYNFESDLNEASKPNGKLFLQWPRGDPLPR
jgi:hypothetical protein